MRWGGVPIGAAVVALAASTLAGAVPSPGPSGWTDPVPRSAATFDCGFSQNTTINTDQLTALHGTTLRSQGMVVPLGGQEVARFDCRSLVVNQGIVVTVVGSRPLLLVSETSAINGTVTATGAPGGRPAGGLGANDAGGGGAGGVGTRFPTPASPGSGPAPGGAGADRTAGAAGGPGATAGTSGLSTGGGGGGSFGVGTGAAYAPLDFSLLRGGSGGGGGAGTLSQAGGGGGGGGGAIAIVVRQTLLVGAAGRIVASGGAGGSVPAGQRSAAGGGGSGGAVLLSAPRVQFDAGATVNAGGGTPGTTMDDRDGYGGGGGAGHIRIDTNWVTGAPTTTVPALGAPPARPPVDPVESTPVLASGLPSRQGTDGAARLPEVLNEFGPSIDRTVLSDNGRFVAFETTAPQLTDEDNNAASDVYVFDRATGQLDLVSQAIGGGGTGNAESWDPTISADGRFVSFRSTASDLAEGDPGTPGADFFLRDREAGFTTILTSSRQSAGNGQLGRPGSVVLAGQAYQAISADGSTVVMQVGPADRLSPLDTNSAPDIFVWRHDTLQLVSVTLTGGASGGLDPDISGDGSRVVFRSRNPNIVTIPKANCSDCGNVFVRHVDPGVTELVSVNAAGTATAAPGATPAPSAISRDGRFVLWWGSGIDDVVTPAYSPTSGALFLRDLDADVSTLVARTADGTAAYVPFGGGPIGAISADGRYVAFLVEVSGPPLLPDLVNWVGTGGPHLWVRDNVTGVTQAVSTSAFGELVPAGRFFNLAETAPVVTFTSSSPFQEGGNGSGALSVYRHNLLTGQTELVAPIGGALPPFPALSADGTTVAFASSLDGTAPGDTDGGLSDIYLVSVNPSARGIQPTVALRGNSAHVSGHVPCPGTRTAVAITLRQGALTTTGTASVACTSSEAQWTATAPLRDLSAGPAEGCAVATLYDGNRVVNRIEWCRPVTIG